MPVSVPNRFHHNCPIYTQFLHRLFNYHPQVIAMIGASAHMLARVFFAAAQTPAVFWVGGAVSGLGPIVGPMLRSMTSKVVPTNERGRVFALLSVCDNAAPFVSSVLYTQVYNATIGLAPGIFYLTIATQAVVFVLML